MKLFCSAHRLAMACALLGAGALVGCGGSSSSGTPVASSGGAPAAAAPTDTGMDNYVPPSDTGMPGDAPYDGNPTDTASMEAGAPPGDTYDPSMANYDPGMSPYGDPAMGAGYDGGIGGMGMNGMGMGMNGQPGVVDPAPSDDDDYMTKAKYAFAIGKEMAAEQYFVAHLMTHDEEAPDLLKHLRWSPGQRKPTTTIRFAVGVDLKAPPNLEDVRPIGRSQIAQNSGGAAGVDYGAGGDMATGGPTGQGSGGKSFGDLTGKFGEGLITAFETAWNNGDFGTAFKDVDAIIPVNRPLGGINAMAGMGGMAYDGTAYDGGMAPGMTPGMDGAGGAPGTAPADAALRLKATPGKAIVPGLTYLGTGSQNELADKASKEGIDFLFVFDVTVKPTRGLVQNDTRMRLISVKDGTNLGTTLSLNALKVDRETAMKGESDDVSKQVGNVFRKLEALRLSDLPKLEPVHAQARIKALIDKDPKEPLQTLMEIRLFNSIGLLDKEQCDAAYQLALGGSGIAFVSGTVEDKEAVLNPLLLPYK